MQNYASLLPKGKLSTREDVDNFLTSMDSNNSCKGVQVGRSKVGTYVHIGECLHLTSLVLYEIEI